MADTPPANPFEAPEESALFEMNPGPQASHYLESPSASAGALAQSENSGSRYVQIGQVLDGFQIIQLLGQGGMGAVYKARKDGVDYALKVLLSDEIGASEIARFEREAQAAAVVRHPNIIAVHKLALSGYCPYIVFDFVEGWSLDKEIVKGEPWPLATAIERLKPIAAALDHIHQNNIVHRDLKPANIMIRAYDQAPMLADFGLAHAGEMERLTRTGEILGTPIYMTPEQLTGERTIPQTDVWPLGVILYEMLTGGERPFGGETTIALAQAILLKEPASVSSFVSVNGEALDYVLEKALAKDVKKRYQSAGAFLADCDLVESGKFNLSQELGIVELGQRRVKNASRSVVIGFVFFLFLFIAGAAGVFQFQSQQAQVQWGETQAASIKELQADAKNFPRHFALELFRRLTLLDEERIEPIDGPGAEFAANVKTVKDRFELERVDKDKKLVSQIEERLGKLEKVANSWNALVEMRLDEEDKAFSMASDDYRGLLVGYQALRKQQWRPAENAFRDFSGRQNEINVVVLFARLLAQCRLGKPYTALKSLKAEEANLGGEFKAFRMKLARELFVESLLQEQFSQDRISELMTLFETDWKPKGKFKEESERFSAELKSAFEKRLNKNGRLSSLARAYRNVHEASRHNPYLRLLPLNERLARHLAERETRDYMAQVYYLELVRLNRQAKIPEKYSSRQHGEFSYLGLFIHFQRLPKEDYCKLIVELSRHNFYLPDTTPKVIRSFEEKKVPLLTEALRSYPKDIYLRFWRGYCKESDRLNTGYNERIRVLKLGDAERIRLTEKVANELEESLASRLSDLSEALKPGTLHPLFEGLAKQQICEINMVRTYLQRNEVNVELKAKSLKLIQSVPSLIPAPAELSNLELRWTLYDYRGQDREECFAIAKRGLRELSLAFEDSKRKESESRRPFGLPYSTITEHKKNYQTAGWQGLIAETHERSAEYAKAHRAYRESTLTQINDRVLGQWINMIRHHGNLKDFEEVKETILRLLGKDKSLRPLSPDQRKLCELFLDRDYERVKAFLKKRGPK